MLHGQSDRPGERYFVKHIERESKLWTATTNATLTVNLLNKLNTHVCRYFNGFKSFVKVDYRVRQITFFKCFKNNYWIFLQISFCFYWKVPSFRLIMENNFIQMVAQAGHAVAYTIDPISMHIIYCVQLYFTNTYIQPLIQDYWPSVSHHLCCVC